MVTLNSLSFRDSALRDLTPEQLKSLESCANPVRFRSGDVLFERGKDITRFFLILSGQVSISAYTPERGWLTIQTLSAGDLCGTSWLTPPFKWKMDAKAATDVEAVAFNIYGVQELLEKDRELGFAFMRSCFIAISHRLEACQKLLLAQLSKRDS
jgi:CRP/FNR family cyclic AMP-dependent transcriptional regulator